MLPTNYYKCYTNMWLQRDGNRISRISYKICHTGEGCMIASHLSEEILLNGSSTGFNSHLVSKWERIVVSASFCSNSWILSVCRPHSPTFRGTQGPFTPKLGLGWGPRECVPDWDTTSQSENPFLKNNSLFPVNWMERDVYWDEASRDVPPHPLY